MENDSNTPNTLFEQLDTNKDGKLDNYEFRKLFENGEGVISPSQELSIRESDLGRNSVDRYHRYERRIDNENDWAHTVNGRTFYGTTTLSRNFISDTPIFTTNSLETSEYLERRGIRICSERQPRIIRRRLDDTQATYEQRVSVRYLRPPALPPSGTLTIKEVRAEQPPPAPAVLIRERPPSPYTPPPLILRERPPTPPPILPDETIIRTLPALPAPPQSVVIERYPAPSEKPRDIIIERWLPYEQQSGRRTVIQRAPPAIEYEQPCCTIIIYEGSKTNVVRKFEKLEIVDADPKYYTAQYGTSLLSSTALIQTARNIGVIDEISLPALSINTTTSRGIIDYNRANDYTRQGFLLSGSTSGETIVLDADAKDINRGSKTYVYSTSKHTNDGDSAASSTYTRREIQTGGETVSVSHT